MDINKSVPTKTTFSLFGINIFSRSFTLETPPAWLDTFFAGIKSSSGEKVNSNTAMTFSAVFGCVKIIAETIASLGIDLFRKIDDSIQVDKQNISYKIITGNPSDSMLRFNFYESLVSQVLLWGNGYAIIKRNNGAAATELILIDQSDTSVKPELIILPNGKREIQYEVDGFTQKFAEDEVLHIAGLGFNGIVGQSVMENFRETVGLAISQKKFAGKFYANNAQFGSIFKHPGNLTEPAQKRLTRAANKSHAGADKAFNSFVLEEGMDLIQTSMPLKDAQYIESLKFNIEEVARIYRVPLHLLQELARSTNNNIEQQDIDFVKHTIRPWLKRIEPELERKLLTEKDKKSGDVFIKFNIDSLLRGDIKSRAEWYDKMLLNGTFNRDEVRALEMMNPIKDGSGQLHTIQNQNTKLENLGKDEKEEE